MRIGKLKKTYQSRTVLDTQPMDIEKGRIYAVVGANGSGKSTFLRCIAGSVKPDDDAAVTRESGEKLGYMPQSSYPFKMSLMKNLLVGLPRTRENLDRAERLIRSFGMEELRSSRSDRLSGGERQKMALMRILMRDYDVILLDEPTSAMDPRGALAAEKLIRGYRDETGCTVLMVTHSMKQAERIADSVIFLSEGKTKGPVDTASFLSGDTGDREREFLEFWGA